MKIANWTIDSFYCKKQDVRRLIDEYPNTYFKEQKPVVVRIDSELKTIPDKKKYAVIGIGRTATRGERQVIFNWCFIDYKLERNN